MDRYRRFQGSLSGGLQCYRHRLACGLVEFAKKKLTTFLSKLRPSIITIVSFVPTPLGEGLCLPTPCSMVKRINQNAKSKPIILRDQTRNPGGNIPDSLPSNHPLNNRYAPFSTAPYFSCITISTPLALRSIRSPCSFTSGSSGNRRCRSRRVSRALLF